MAEQRNPLAWTDDQVRVLLLLQRLEFDGLAHLLIEKGLITQEELIASIDESRCARIMAIIGGLNAVDGFEDVKLAP